MASTRKHMREPPVAYNGEFKDEEPVDGKYTRFEAVDGFFLHSSNDTDDDAQPLAPPRLGLVDAGDDRWETFHAKIQALKKEYSGRADVKLVLMSRHGQGFHNEAEQKYGTIEWDRHYSRLPEFFDPHLTPLGVEQLQDVFRVMAQEVAAGMPFPFVVSSPHTRTLETAREEWLQVHDSLDLDLFSSDTTTTKGSSNERFRVLALDEFRETIGEHTCDSRRSTLELAPLWPRFDFSAIKVAQDAVWRHDWRETPEDVLTRVERGFQWVFSNVESDYVAVVAHSGVMAEAIRLTGHRPFTLKPGSILPLVVLAHY